MLRPYSAVGTLRSTTAARTAAPAISTSAMAAVMWTPESKAARAAAVRASASGAGSVPASSIAAGEGFAGPGATAVAGRRPAEPSGRKRRLLLVGGGQDRAQDRRPQQ